MQDKIKKAVLAALRRNTFTAHQAIEVEVYGRHVVLVGEVNHEELVYEAIATAESVSAKLHIHNRLTVQQPVMEVERVPAL